jgi:hypothetical protein
MATLSKLTEQITKLSFNYPTAYLPKGDDWDAMLGTWSDAFCDFPDHVIETSFERVKDLHRGKFPNLPEVLEVVRAQNEAWEKEQATKTRDRMLAGPLKDSLQNFESACQVFLEQVHSEEYDERVKGKLDGLICLMVACFGFHPNDGLGDPNSDDPSKRFNYARALTYSLETRKIPPRAVAHGLKKIPGIFAKVPTELMIAELCWGSFNRLGWPSEYFRGES